MCAAQKHTSKADCDEWMWVLVFKTNNRYNFPWLKQTNQHFPMLCDVIIPSESFVLGVSWEVPPNDNSIAFEK